MDLTETDDQLTIVNRSKEHRISKKKIYRMPYFEKMLSDGINILESKGNKIELNFDEQAFVSFLNWIELGYIFIEMKNVINLFDILSYFEILHLWNSDLYLKTYFHDNFTIEHLPIVLPQVTSTSKLINSGALNAFLCRHFPKIANTSVWLDYPVEIIEYICALDLMIHSEIQVFEAILRWVNFKADSRKCSFDKLLNLIRWCHLEAKDLSKIVENEFFKSLGLKPVICYPKKANCNCGINRTDQNYFIMIEELGDSVLRVKVLDNNLLPLFNRIMEPDSSMPSPLLHDQHISDVFHEFGGIIRFDWNRNQYKNLGAHFDPYVEKIYKCIFESDRPHEIKSERFVEANERFIFIDWCLKAWYWPKHTIEGNRIFPDSYRNFSWLATVLDTNIYLLTKQFELLQFDLFFQNYKTIYTPFNRSIYPYDYKKNVILASKQYNDDRVILIDTLTKDARCFNVSTREWSSINHIIYPSTDFNDEKKESCKLFTFTSAFLSMDIIRLCSSH